MLKAFGGQIMRGRRCWHEVLKSAGCVRCGAKAHGGVRGVTDTGRCERCVLLQESGGVQTAGIAGTGAMRAWCLSLWGKNKFTGPIPFFRDRLRGQAGKVWSAYLEASVSNPRTAQARRRGFSEIRARPLWLSFLQGPGGGAGRGSRATNLKVKAEDSSGPPILESLRAEIAFDQCGLPQPSVDKESLQG